MKFMPSLFKPALNMPSGHVIGQSVFRRRLLACVCRRCLFLAKAASLHLNYLLLVGAVSRSFRALFRSSDSVVSRSSEERTVTRWSELPQKRHLEGVLSG